MTEIWTIGHSTLGLDEFTEHLVDHGIETLVDIRSYPGSARYPWFNPTGMRAHLAGRGIGYTHIPKLGGRRKKQDVDRSLNAAWKNASFRNYADWTMSQDYEDGLKTLEDLALESRVAYMCSEAVPWRCHRSIVSTSLVALGWTVRHIIGDSLTKHELGAWGPKPALLDGRVTYPLMAGQQTLWEIA